jgi:predicted RNase H-related nuclease YkuK (DUF458 family)
MWRNGKGDKVTLTDVLSFVEKAHASGSQVVVGTDSQPFNHGTFSVSVIAFLSNDRSVHGRYFYLEHSELTKHHNLFERIYHEVNLTINLIDSIKHLTPIEDIEVHIDVSPDNGKTKTSRWSNTLVSMVRGYGVREVCVKPSSWCASKLADAYTKKRSIRVLRNRSQ